MSPPEHQRTVDLQQIFAVARRRALVILLCLVAVAGAAFAVSKNQPKEYTATASLVFNNAEIGQQVAGLQAVNTNEAKIQQTTDVELVELGDMAAKTAAKLGAGLTKERVQEKLTINAQGESNIVNVAASAGNPALAAAIANTYTNQFVKEQQTKNQAYYASALRLVERQLKTLTPKQKLSPSGIALAGRSQSLGVLAELHNGNVEIAQAATVPTSPSSPKVGRNTALGAILGLLLGIGIAFLLERFDRRIREPKDLEKIYGLPLLGVVPESSTLQRIGGGQGLPGAALPSGEAEAFHLIRAHMRYFNVDRELRTLMVASAAPGDGKTTVARHLAAASARVGARVLLLEADLRRPTIARQLGLIAGRGVSDVLIGSVALAEAVHRIELVAPTTERPDGHSFDVLVAGATPPPNPGELIESKAMESLLEQAKAIYDLVVIDTPPLTAVSDAFPLLKKVDGVVIVGRVGRNRRDVAERLHETLTGAGAPLLGVVANGFKSGRSGGYGYGYGYDYSPKSDAPADADTPVSPNGAAAEEPVPSANG